MSGLTLNTQTLADKFNAGDFVGLASDILQILHFFETQKFEQADSDFLANVEVLTDTILQIIAAAPFEIPALLAPEFIRHNGTLANMVRLTRHHNTDAFLVAVNAQPHNLLKMLTLYSPYCSVRLPLAALFQAHPYLTSLWVAAILKHRWKGTEATYRFVQNVIGDPALERFTLDDPQFPLSEDAAFAYFDATYSDPHKDRTLREIINARTKETFRRTFKMGTDNKRILVISANMNMANSIYRCLAPLLYALKPDYHLTLFHIKPVEEGELDTKLFDDIKTLGVKDANDAFTYEMLERILAGNYGIALFSDVGLNRPSIILSNLRLAPIQITTYGHPVTTGNSEIDYYIGGRAVEETANPQRHFGEQLVLMPGLGVEPVRLHYRPKFPPRAYDWLEIGLSWGEIKCNYPHLTLLREIQQKTTQKMRFHFIGINATRLTLLAARKDLEEFFGAEHIHVSASMPNAQYLEAMERCDLLLDSFHFGSYNRIVDALTLHKPVIALEGEKSFNRFASALLRQVGLDELVATTPQAFVEKSLRLIEEGEWREGILARIRNLDLEKALFETGNARYFKTAIDTIVAQHTAHPKGNARAAMIIQPS